MKISNIYDHLALEGGHQASLIYLKGAANQNHFWIDVLNAWCSFVKCHVPASQIDALKNVLWHNQNIMVGNKHINYKHWAKKGVNFVCDIFDAQGVALSLVAFQRKFRVRTNFFEYGGVVNAIKHSFHYVLNGETSEIARSFLPFNFETLLMDIKGSTRLYSVFTSSKKVVHKFIVKWEEKLGVIFPIPKWHIFCGLPFNCTCDTKLRWFQFRLVHRILGVNSFLSKIGRKNSNLCTFCKMEE